MSFLEASSVFGLWAPFSLETVLAFLPTHLISQWDMHMLPCIVFVLASVSHSTCFIGHVKEPLLSHLQSIQATMPNDTLTVEPV